MKDLKILAKISISQQMSQGPKISRSYQISEDHTQISKSLKNCESCQDFIINLSKSELDLHPKHSYNFEIVKIFKKSNSLRIFF